VRQEVAAEIKSAVVKVSGSVEGGGERVVLEVAGPDGEVVLKVEEELNIDSNGKGDFEVSLKVEKPELWWPFMYGSQPLYTVSATLPGFDTQSRKVGFRRLRLLQHALKKEPGTSLTFDINNVRIFCGGSCWIPGDYLLSRFSETRYQTWARVGVYPWVSPIKKLVGSGG